LGKLQAPTRNVACLSLKEVHMARHVARRSERAPATKLGALALGAAAMGAIAVGALAIGALAVGRMTIKNARIGALEFDELTVRRLRVLENVPPERRE
jgi:hypothetical protein